MMDESITSTKSSANEADFAKQKHPLEKANIIQQMMFTWLDPFINRTTKGKIFEQSMHPKIPHADRATNNFTRLWENRARNKGKGLLSNLWGVYGLSFFISVLFMLAMLSFGALKKYFLYLISLELEVQFKKEESISRDWNDLLVLIGFLIILTILDSSFNQLIQLWRMRFAFRVEFSLSCMVYDKLLRIGLINPSSHDEGSLTNNLQVDCGQFGGSIFALTHIISTIGNLGISIGMGVWLFKWRFFVMIGVLTMSTMLMYLVTRGFFYVQNKWMDSKDKRMGAWKYCFSSVRYFKIRAWETDIFSKMNSFRDKELKYQFLKMPVIHSIYTLILVCGPAVSVYAFLKVYFDSGNSLEISKVAIFITLIFEMTAIFASLPGSFNFLGEVMIGLKRLNKVMNTEEIYLDAIRNVEPPLNPDSAIELKNASFYWKTKPLSEDEEKKEQDEMKKELKQKDDLVGGSFSSNSNLRESLLEIEQDPNKPSYELNISLIQIPRGKVSFVIGKIGSGKSSLLYSLLGEMSIKNPAEARLTIQGSVAYVGQKPWILNSTVKKNILLDMPFDQNRLDEAIKYSCLDEDLKVFGNGVDQETGEGGDGLSGGQRTRIAIARCLYQNPDVYIFDDILSALDSNVGAFIMETTILNYLKDKTVLMSTHAIQYLSSGHQILIMDDGKIEAQGNFDEIRTCEIYQKYLEINRMFAEKNKKKEELSGDESDAENNGLVGEIGELELIRRITRRRSSKLKEHSLEFSENSLIKGADEEILKQLIIPEDREKGAVSLRTYHLFIKQLGGYIVYLFAFLSAGACVTVTKINYFRLAKWSEEFGKEDKYKVLNEYFLTSLVAGFLSAFKGFVFGLLGYYVSRRFHSKMIYSILHSRVEEFLSRVPAGRIMNRFSKDLSMIDGEMHYLLEWFNFTICEFLLNIAFSGYLVGYQMMIAFIFMIVFCGYFQNTFMETRREFMRLESISKTPVVNLLIDSCKGLTDIRAMNKQSYFRKQFMTRCDEHFANTLIVNAINQWYSLRTNIVSCLFILIPTYLIIIMESSSITLASAVFTIVISSSLDSSIRDCLLAYSRLEGIMISVERCNHFEKIEPEAQYKHYNEDMKLVDGTKSSIEKLKKNQKKNTVDVVTEGRIQFKNMSCRYVTSKNPILSKLTFDISPGEKVGVIGRTGSGKSTLIKLLWRGLDYFEGEIKIDGKNIQEVDLKSLRSQVMIVTQETALIEGTLRENIDIRLEDNSRDDEIIQILRKLGFENHNYLNNGLDMKIDGEGSNLSAGEKQLVSFARTLFDKKKIMILDEATANIDLKTEERIQMCVENEFKETTMIIIAHRIQTIMNCDRILILEKGKIAAFDTPANLSNEKDSYFTHIINKMKEKK